MKIVANSVQPLSLVLTQPASNLFYNWSQNIWESPFDVTKHIKATAPMNNPFTTVQWVDIPDLLATNPAVATVWVVVVGTTVSVVDCWTLWLQSTMVGGGFLRA